VGVVKFKYVFNNQIYTFGIVAVSNFTVEVGNFSKVLAIEVSLVLPFRWHNVIFLTNKIPTSSDNQYGTDISCIMISTIHLRSFIWQKTTKLNDNTLYLATSCTTVFEGLWPFLLCASVYT